MICVVEVLYGSRRSTCVLFSLVVSVGLNGDDFGGEGDP